MVVGWLVGGDDADDVYMKTEERHNKTDFNDDDDDDNSNNNQTEKPNAEEKKLNMSVFLSSLSISTLISKISKIAYNMTHKDFEHSKKAAAATITTAEQ